MDILIYFFNACISTVYFYFFRQKNKLSLLFPLILIWTIIIGGQYNVGTDYFSYLKIFYNENKLELYYRQQEYIFYFFIKLLRSFFKNGQFFFIIVGLIENLLLLVIIKKLINNKVLTKKYLYLFIFIFFCYGSIFYNQMNMIRQYFNIYILMFLSFYILKKEFIKYNLLFIVGVNIHRSLLFLYPIYFIFNYILKKVNFKTVLLIFILGVLLSLINLENEISYLIKEYVPRYSNFLNDKFFIKTEIKTKITKLIFIPFYFESIFLIEKEKSIKNEFLKIGICSYVIKLITLNIVILTRVGEYFNFFILFPIYFLIENYIKDKKKIKLFILLSLIMVIFCIKVLVFPSGEYLYKFYLFN